jgi:hypothetical protein
MLSIAALALCSVLGAGPLAATLSDDLTAMFLVSYSPKQSQAVELRCLEHGDSLDCKGVQLIVTKQNTGECTFQQWPVHELSLQRNGNGRWQALIPSRLCTNYSTVYLLEKQGKYRWHLTLDTMQTGKPRTALEKECSAAKDFPPRVVYVRDYEKEPAPAEMGCSVVRLTP